MVEEQILPLSGNKLQASSLLPLALQNYNGSLCDDYK
jgi:hypothetical protein